MAGKEIGVGIIGLGFIGGRAHLPSLRKIDSARIVSVADLEESLLEKYGKPPIKALKDYHDMLEDPDVDAVWVCLPNFLHGKITMEALEAGKNVFCEMPMANTVEECKKIVEMSKKTGKVVTPGATFRWTPNYMKIKELMDKGKVGKPTMFYHKEYLPPSIIGKQWPAGSWAWDEARSGGTSFTLSVWAIDLMNWLLDSDAKSVYANIRKVPQEKYGGITPENCQFHVTYENGVAGVFERSENSPFSIEGAEFRMLFDDNSAVVAVNNNELELHEEIDRTCSWHFHETGPRVWGHQQLDQHFVETLAAGKEPDVTATDGLKIVKVAEAMSKSAKSGDVIRL